MIPQDKKILVLGATGHQGGAVLEHLEKQGFKDLHALVRSADEEKAQELAARGITLAVGDLDQPESLVHAMQEVYGVFSVLPLVVEDGEVEIRRGKAVGDAAKASSVQHFVYSSVGGAERSQGVMHFESKYKVEEYLHQLGLPLSVVRPVSFMENFNGPMHPQEKDGVLVVRLAFRPATRMQFIAVTDIGRIVADMFSRPETSIGQTLEIAGDQLTGPQIAETFARVTGKPVRFEEQPIAEIEAFNTHFANMFRWLNDHGYKADIAALRQTYPELMTFEAWLKQNYKT